MLFNHVVMVPHAQTQIKLYCFYYNIRCVLFKIAFGSMLILDGRGVCLVNHNSFLCFKCFRVKKYSFVLQVLWKETKCFCQWLNLLREKEINKRWRRNNTQMKNNKKLWTRQKFALKSLALKRHEKFCCLLEETGSSFHHGFDQSDTNRSREKKTTKKRN